MARLMGLVRPLDEIGEGLLRLELTQRARHRAAGVCDFCGKPPSAPICKFPRRHRDPRIGVAGLADPVIDVDRQLAIDAAGAGIRFEKYKAMQNFLLDLKREDPYRFGARAAQILEGDL